MQTQTIKVLMLGPRGAGKTVYLGSMFHKLSTAGQKGFFLYAPKSQRIALNSAYYSLSTEHKWPEATGMSEWREYEFEIQVQSRITQTNYTACKVVYYDYAGGRINEPQFAELAEEFEEKVKSSDILMVLLDGYKLHRILKGDSITKRKFFDNDLSEVCRTLQYYPQNTIHFVISKWDLFEDSNSTIEIIRDLLLRYEHFSNIVLDKIKNGVVRFIPVSSTGYDYASMNETAKSEKEVMQIVEGGSLSPFQVEMPFACILPDILEEGHKADLLKKKKDATVYLDRRKNEKIDPEFTTVQRLRVGLSALLEDFSTRIADKVRGRAVDTKVSQAIVRKEEHIKLAEELKEKVEDEESALLFGMQSMFNMVDQLDAKYPSSVMSVVLK